MDLIAPCSCTGSIKWIHRACVDHWRHEKQGTDLYTHCELCKTPYAVSRRTLTLWDYLRVKVPLKERIFYALELAYLVIKLCGFAERQVRTLRRLSRSRPNLIEDEPSSSLVLLSPGGPLNILSVITWCVWWLCRITLHSTATQPSYDLTILIFHITSTVRHVLEFLRWRRESAFETVVSRSELTEHG